jgi:hypothetical protein
MKAYKLMKLRKDGTLGSLFINAKEVYPINVWMKSQNLPTKGFAVRPGWHCCFKMLAPHLKLELVSGEKRVWVEVEVEDYQVYKKPLCQGGQWILADRMKILGIVKGVV